MWTSWDLEDVDQSVRALRLWFSALAATVGSLNTTIFIMTLDGGGNDAVLGSYMLLLGLAGCLGGPFGAINFGGRLSRILAPAPTRRYSPGMKISLCSRQNGSIY
jgi:hypothetical protein